MFNSVTLVGRLGQEVEIRYAQQSGNAVGNFSLAVDRPFKNNQGEKETDWFRIVCFGKTAENSANYLSKGSKALVNGRLQTRNYEDREGIKRWITEIVANQVVFLDGKKSESEQGFKVEEDDVPPI